MRQDTRAYLLLVGCSLIWGFTFVAQRLGAEHLGAYAFNAARGYLGVLALLPLVWFLDTRAARSPHERLQAWRSVVKPGLCTDNGAMMAALGAEVVRRGHRPSSLDIGANSGLPISTVLV